MKIEHLVWGFLMFSFAFVAGSFIFTDISENHNVNVNMSEYSSVFNDSEAIYNVGADMSNKTLSAQLESGEQTEDSTIGASYSAIRHVSNTYGWFGNIANDISQIYGLPPFVSRFLITFFTLAVTLAIIFLFLRLRS